MTNKTIAMIAIYIFFAGASSLHIAGRVCTEERFGWREYVAAGTFGLLWPVTISVRAALLVVNPQAAFAPIGCDYPISKRPW